MTSALTDLIAKLEAAGEGSRELDALIWCALNGAAYVGSHADATEPGNCFWFRHPADGVEYSRAAHYRYTTSLDAALTLVPEGWMPSIDQYCLSDVPAQNQWRVWLRRLRDEETRRPKLDTVFGITGTPALALCIAALKARAALSPSDNS